MKAFADDNTDVVKIIILILEKDIKTLRENAKNFLSGMCRLILL